MSPAVLVTGGAGYVGSHVALALAGRYEVVVLDNLSEGHRELVPEGVGFEYGDVRDRATLARVFGRRRFQAVIHLAGRAYVGESVGAPALYYDNNVLGSFTLLEAMRAFEVEALVFSSTCAVYGSPSSLPLGETAPTSPINAYGASKLAVEEMVRWYGRAYSMRAVVLRYFNAAGADPEQRAGEWHEPEPHLVPLLLAACDPGGQEELAIFGDDYGTADGSCVRDFIHVSDLAAAHRLALDHMVEGGASLCLNLGTGAGHSVWQLLRAAEAATGHPARYRIAPRRRGDPAALVADPSQAAKLLGWRAERSATASLLDSAWAWRNARRRRAAAGAP